MCVLRMVEDPRIFLRSSIHSDNRYPGIALSMNYDHKSNLEWVPLKCKEHKGPHDRLHRMDGGNPSELESRSGHKSVEANRLKVEDRIPSHTNTYMRKGSAHVTNCSQDNATPWG